MILNMLIFLYLANKFNDKSNFYTVYRYYCRFIIFGNFFYIFYQFFFYRFSLNNNVKVPIALKCSRLRLKRLITWHNFFRKKPTLKEPFFEKLQYLHLCIILNVILIIKVHYDRYNAKVIVLFKNDSRIKLQRVITRTNFIKY